jgi:hypothetical protein
MSLLEQTWTEPLGGVSWVVGRLTVGGYLAFAFLRLVVQAQAGLQLSGWLEMVIGESAVVPPKLCAYICVVMWRMKHSLGKPSAGFHSPTVKALAAKGLTIQDPIKGNQDKIRAAVPLTIRVQRLDIDHAILVRRVQAPEMVGSPAGNNQ